MKVLVLAIDGLEEKLVKRWNLRSLMQKYCGTYDVTVAVKGEKLYTPLIWSSFLLGEASYKYGLTLENIRAKREKIGYGALAPLYYLRRKIFGDRKLGIRKFLVKLGIYNLEKVSKELHSIESLPPEVRKRTIIEEARERGYSVWVSEFPGLGTDLYFGRVRATFSQYFDKGFNKRLKLLEELYEVEVKMLSEAVRASQNHELTLYYSASIDMANHMFYRPRKIKAMVALANHYKKVNAMVEKFISPLRKSHIILIVSDHGYDPNIHEHSEYGFWSLNVKPPKIPKTVLDFKNLIYELLKL